MNQSEQIGELAKALSKFQGQMECVAGSDANPYYKTKYAKLHVIRDAIRIPLSQNELSVIHSPQYENGIDLLETILMHSSGQWKRSVIHVRTAKPDCQSLGAGLTYTQRQALCCILGLATFEDDDGEEERKAFEKQESKHMKRPAEPPAPMNMSVAASIQPPAIDHSTVRLQKAVCATGYLIGEDDVTKFLEYLVEKYPKKTRADLIASALASDEKVVQFSTSMREWKDRPAS